MKKLLFVFAVAVGVVPGFVNAVDVGIHGGDAVACFGDKDLAETVRRNGRLTQAILNDLVSIVPYEEYVADLSGISNPKVQALKKGKFSEAFQGLIALFDNQPVFSEKLRDAHRRLGFMSTKGIPLFSPIEDTKDLGFEVPIPENCAYLQAAARIKDQTFYNQMVWKALSPFGQALFELHVLIYFVATEMTEPPQMDSMMTQLLIRSVLMVDLDSGVLREKLIMYKFRTQDPHMVCSGARELLKGFQLYQGASYVNDFVTNETCLFCRYEFTSKPYLRFPTLQGWAESLGLMATNVTKALERLEQGKKEVQKLFDDCASPDWFKRHPHERGCPIPSEIDTTRAKAKSESDRLAFVFRDQVRFPVAEIQNYLRTNCD